MCVCVEILHNSWCECVCCAECAARRMRQVRRTEMNCLKGPASSQQHRATRRPAQHSYMESEIVGQQASLHTIIRANWMNVGRRQPTQDYPYTRQYSMCRTARISTSISHFIYSTLSAQSDEVVGELEPHSDVIWSRRRAPY